MLVQADMVFMSPPWGGPAYLQAGSTFNLREPFGGLPVNLAGLIEAAASALRPPHRARRGQLRRGMLCIFLPRNSDLSHVAEAVPDGAKWEVERNVLNGHLKAISLYVWL